MENNCTEQGKAIDHLTHSDDNMGLNCICGIGLAITGIFPAAIITALLYGFPVPMAGLLSGPSAIGGVLLAVLVYGIMFGGFVLLGILGAVCGISTSSISTRRNWTHRTTFLYLVLTVFVVDMAVAIVFATSDKIFGPW